MKPTLSYVRGLRDVLEMETKEERRKYVGFQSLTNIFHLMPSEGGGLRGMLPINVAGAIALGGAIAKIRYGDFYFVIVGAIPLLLGMGYLLLGTDREKYVDAISQTTRNQQYHIQIKNRKPNDFPESKLALDNFE